MLVLYPAHLHKGLLPFILRKQAGYEITDIFVGNKVSGCCVKDEITPVTAKRKTHLLVNLLTKLPMHSHSYIDVEPNSPLCHLMCLMSCTITANS